LVSKVALISSFHSYSLMLADLKPKAILSFDSHIDDYFNGGEESYRAIGELPFPIRSMFLRVSVHNMLGRTNTLRGVPIYLIIPKGCFENRVYCDDLILKERGMDVGDVFEAKKSFTERILGIKLFFHPPRDLDYLLRKIKKHTTAVDFDVDYFEEFQDYCYTKAPKFIYEDGSISKVGALNDFYKIINHICPNTVIISEVKVSQIKSSTGPFSRIIDFLKDKRYEIRFDELVESDEVAEKWMKKQEDFINLELKKAKDNFLLTSSQSDKEFMESLIKEDIEQARIIRDFFKT
jgi:hypothetical protein